MIVLLGAASLGLASARVEPPRTFMECTGHDDLHSFSTEHEITIYDGTAEVDGSHYRMKKTRTQFTLTGPSPKYDRVFHINRLTGEWALTPSALNGDPTGKLESSGKGERCEAKKRRF